MSRFLKPVVSLLYRSALQGCRTVFFQNPDDLELFLEKGLVEKSKTRLVAGSGVNLDHFSFSEIIPGPPRFLMIARLIEDKGVRVYAEAARLLKSRHPQAVVRLLGFIDDHPRAITKSDLEGWIRSGDLEFLGAADDVRPQLRQCSVYCLPSYREGTPRTVLEAMATGRPIITTDAPGCRETVLDGQNGFLVPTRDPVALANAMEKFMEDDELPLRMGKISRELAESKFDVVQVNASMIQDMGLRP